VKIPYSHPEPAMESLPPTPRLLTKGGDFRLVLDAVSGLNLYGCGPFPDPALLAYGSSTASVISEAGYQCADVLRMRLLEALKTASPMAVYRREMARVRGELLRLCALPPTTEVIFSPSGTDGHALAVGESRPARIVMIDANETGKGVAAALIGSGLDNRPEVMPVRVRRDDGAPRPPADIDADAEALASEAAAKGLRVLLILIDQSKTGLIAPSPGCVLALRRRFPDNIDVLVDACQFRIAPPALRAYLEHGFMIALTGSKFLTGPSFSGALLLTQETAQRLQSRSFPVGADGPSNRAMPDTVNFGLLLRWEAALRELQAFRSLPEATVMAFIRDFSAAIHRRLKADPLLEALPVAPLDRRPAAKAGGWDQLQTIFPFLLYHADAGRPPLSTQETLHVYRQLPVDLRDHPRFAANASIAALRCQTGQPAACGERGGIGISALRLCLDARLMVKAAADGDNGAAVIAGALAVLDKTALLIRAMR
jgi:hypothetical protein